jgi:hypothetical protein
MCLFLQDNTFKKIYFVLKLFLMIPTVSISLSLPLSLSLFISESFHFTNYNIQLHLCQLFIASTFIKHILYSRVVKQEEGDFCNL